MLNICLRPPSRQLIRTFSSSARKLDHFPNVDQKGFKRALQVKGKIVIADFYADWCGPCKVLGPILEKVTKDGVLTSSSGKPFDLVTVDTDNQGELAMKYGVRALPTVIAFKDGEPVAKFVGAIPESKVTEFLKSV
ncbi:thioredoxin-like protein [Thelephora ganbajun]|uniref:Thioredoxin-like protein n=1 Tax=Thelephora ganbajun TaxID=370292 RepID=A0ACB6ZP39_THEGA|nr:thioredoxin-like protein [Thelephora ganbajun]